MDNSTKIITLKMNTAEARDVCFALLVESANVLRDIDLRGTTASLAISRRLLAVNERIKSLLTAPGSTGKCIHGMSFAIPCSQCLGYFAREKENEAGFIPMFLRQAD